MGTKNIVPIINHGIYIGLPVSERLMLYEAWNKGRVDIRPVTHADIRYTLSYIDKQVFGYKQLYEQFGDFEPPFAHFSKGLGVEWIEKNLDKFDETGKLYFTEKKVYTLPPYFRDKYGFIKVYKKYSDSVIKYAEDNHIKDLDEAKQIRDKLKARQLQRQEIKKFGTKIDLERDEYIQAWYKKNQDYSSSSEG